MVDMVADLRRVVGIPAPEPIPLRDRIEVNWTASIRQSMAFGVAVGKGDAERADEHRDRLCHLSFEFGALLEEIKR